MSSNGERGVAVGLWHRLLPFHFRCLRTDVMDCLTAYNCVDRQYIH